jgi:hypothetical protein
MFFGERTCDAMSSRRLRRARSVLRHRASFFLFDGTCETRNSLRRASVLFGLNGPRRGLSALSRVALREW